MVMKTLFAAFVAAVSAQRGTFGNLNESTSTLKFNIPQDLRDLFPDGVRNSQAMFGSPSFGHAASITGVIVYASSDDHDACLEFDQHNVSSWPTEPVPVIVMIDRGSCTFVTKVRHAQQAGARAVIVVDSINERGLPLMADDGTGGDITVPSILIHNDDGKAIQNFMRFKVTGTMAWNLPHPDGRVEWDFWTSSDDLTTEHFKNQFKKASVHLGADAKMTPHYFFIDGRYQGCQAGGQRPECLAQCTNDGRYCAIDPEQDISEGLSGAMVVEENLRQMCLWKVHLADDNDPAIWFDYVTQFDKECVDPTDWSVKCSEDIMTELGLDPIPVAACVTESNVKNGTNTLIENEMKLQIERGIFFNPTITINNIPFRGTLSCPDPIDTKSCSLLQAICAGYADDSIPKTCQPSDCPLGEDPNPWGGCGGNVVQDECGEKFQSINASGFNKKCLGCDSIPNSGKVTDDCGNCAGPGMDLCGNCFKEGDSRRVTEDASLCTTGGFPKWAVFIIIISIVAVVGITLIIVMKARENAMRADVDSLLKGYMHMDAETGTAAGAAVQVHT